MEKVYDYIERVKLSQHAGYTSLHGWQMLPTHMKAGLLSSKGLFEMEALNLVCVLFAPLF